MMEDRACKKDNSINEWYSISSHRAIFKPDKNQKSKLCLPLTVSRVEVCMRSPSLNVTTHVYLPLSCGDTSWRVSLWSSVSSSLDAT